MTDEELSQGLDRLYLLARGHARKTWGDEGYKRLGPDLKRAVILAEVLHVIANQDETVDPARMKALADYAVLRVQADTPHPS